MVKKLKTTHFSLFYGDQNNKITVSIQTSLWHLIISTVKFLINFKLKGLRNQRKKIVKH